MGLLDRFIEREEQPTRVTDAEAARIAKRVGFLSTSELAQWIDNTLSATGRAVESYTREQDDAYLVEAELDVRTLLALVEELKSRAQT